MKKFFEEHVDKKRLEILIDVKVKYIHGEISLEEGKGILKSQLRTVTPIEIAAAEQELVEFEKDQCQKEDIQAMTILFQDIMDTSRPNLPTDHPIDHYYEENLVLKGILNDIDVLRKEKVIKNKWYELYDKLIEIKTHFSRKQNQLYSVLEKKGFDRPTTTMWTLDDFVRDEIKAFRNLLEENEEEFILQQKTLIEDIYDLLDKEERILYPTALTMITEEEFEDMKIGDEEIGFSWIESKYNLDKKKMTKEKATNGSEFFKDLAVLLNKHGIANTSQELDVATGKLTLEEINLIYKHMPVDLSYVDENELVKFYTDTEHRIFPRSKNVIGRNVKNCHPQSSVHIVEEIIEKFRSGQESEVEFWINKEDVFIYIKYVAVRDEHGKFRGVLEMMQDCSRIRKLEGSQTLLNWSKGQDGLKGAENTEIVDNIDNAPADQNTSLEDAENREKDFGSVTKNTRLADLLNRYPRLKEELPNINSAFNKLKSPLARVMISKANVEMMAERGNMDLEELIDKLNKFIENER